MLLAELLAELARVVVFAVIAVFAAPKNKTNTGHTPAIAALSTRIEVTDLLPVDE